MQLQTHPQVMTNMLKKGSTGTVEDGRKITQNGLGEHKVITTEQQFLGVILSFFMHLRWPWLLRLFAVLL